MGLTWSPASLPFWVLTVGLAIIVLYTILVRGDTLLRVAVLAAATSAVPWAVGTALYLASGDSATVASIGHFAVGPLSLVGPALLFLLLVISGTLERFRYLVLVFVLFGAGSCILTWSTDLVVDGTWRSAWGIVLPASGPLVLFHRGILLLSLLAALLLATRHRSSDRPGMPTGQIALVTGLSALAAIEGLLLSYRIGVYPFSVLFAGAAVIVVIVNLRNHRIVRGRGLDIATAYELLFLAGLVPLLAAITWSATHQASSQTLVAVVLVVPLFAGVQITATLLRDYLAARIREINREVVQRFEEFTERSTEVRDEGQLAEDLRQLLEESTTLTGIRLFINDGRGRLNRVGSTGPGGFVLREVLYDFLRDHPNPLVLADIATVRLGRAREAVERLFDSADADVLVPLVDRDELVGLISATSAEQRSPGDDERQLLIKAGRSTAKALTYVRLVREAKARMEIAKELEVAAAVQHARAPGETRQDCRNGRIVAHYLPAAQFGGDWWMTQELPDDRILVVIGDVAGRGMPAALVSSSVEGACRTAQTMLGASCEVLSLLSLLNQSVLAVGGADYPMSCFAAVIDLEGGIASFANAGHPFPYLCRHKEGEALAELIPLISRGTRLGSREPVLRASTVEVQDGDIIVFYSDALVDARNPEGRRYGDRRLQHVLQRFVHPAGDRACEIIVEDARTYCDDYPVGDDLTIVVVHLRLPRRRSQRDR